MIDSVNQRERRENSDLASGTLFAGVWMESDNIWTDEQCAIDEIRNGVNLEDCQILCEQSQSCTAINFNPTFLDGDCILRICGTPVPPPQGSQQGYKGYFIQGNTTSLSGSD